MAKAFSIKKGNWYVCIKNAHNHNGGVVFTKDKIYQSPKDEYLVRDDNGQPEIIGAFLMEYFHPWTVKDAKPGDFLTYTTEEGEDWYFIFKSEYKPYDGMYHYYAGFTKEFIPGDTGCLDEDSFRPSTPEEKELLLSKIKENGYIWDAEICKLINPSVKESDKDKLTNDERKEILIALCGYFPYGVIVEVEGYDRSKLKGIDNGTVSTERGINYPSRLVKPFLRPMESMTTEEAAAYTATMQVKEVGREKSMTQFKTSQTFDYLDRNFFDYRGLIPRGMAFEAKKGMYNLKKEN